MRKCTKTIPWNDYQDESFRTLKKHGCQAPSLLLPHPSKPFEIEIDANDYVIGEILYQDAKPITFQIKNLQCRYSFNKIAQIHSNEAHSNGYSDSIGYQ